MKLNENTMIVGRKVLLVPYERHHVPKYHEWMKSEELQILTASEPLSLEEEFNMQRSWRDDENKCTFIVLDKSRYETQAEKGTQEQAEIDSMVGDVNFFLDETKQVAEVEIMIAEPDARGHGIGREALCSMLQFGMETIGVRKFEAKIGLQNEPSIKLFTSLGFAETSRSEVFQEITLAADTAESLKDLVLPFTSHFDIQAYNLKS
ncbi:alpha/beta-tubulin-N-acetyltransferase 9-like [Littorina saxatilis]|uniref:N-acetyltransferase 9-like protein n=1 Tax=Littorina saxatilis TaxID=31220 RepID=A0AAN9BT98_9CAEN